MTVSYTTTLRNNRLDEITTLAGATAWLQIWKGAIPAAPDTAPAVETVPMASLALANPISAAASSGTPGQIDIGLAGITDDTSAALSGTPTFARIATSETGTTTGILQMTCGTAAEDLVFDADIVSGGTVAVTALTITDASS